MKKLLTLIILLLILFTSSGQTYDQQSLVPTLEKWLPGKPLESFLSLIHVPYWGIFVSVEERGYYNFVEFLLRKGSHFFMFGFVALAIYSLLPKHSFRYFTAVFITFLLAIGDEFHQSLTSGRTATIQDVILDAAGAIFFLSAYRLLLFLTKPSKKSCLMKN